MKKIFGSLAHILCILTTIAGILALAISYIRASNQYCIDFCTLQIFNWKEPLAYGVILLIGSVILYIVGKKLKK